MSEHRMPIVLSQIVAGDKTAEYRLRIQPELRWFDGHFPGVPVLPGVVQIDWVMHFINDLNLPGKFDGVKRMKFMRLVKPSAQLTLSLNTEANGLDVSYCFYDSDGAYSSGTIVFKA